MTNSRKIGGRTNGIEGGKTSTKVRREKPRTLDRVTFGKRLHSARKLRGLTLAELAEVSEVSITTISRAERGLLALSYEKFSALGRALKMDMGAMFSQVGAQLAKLDRPVVTRNGQGTMYRGEALSYEFLCTQVVGKQMSPGRGTVHARAYRGPQDLASHEGEEFIYVLSGAVEVHFEDGRKELLGRGDSLYYDSRIGHAYVSVSRKLAQIIGVCTSESDLMRSARSAGPKK
jgi:transcriptional regulator with XRE-family HTH domain